MRDRRKSRVVSLDRMAAWKDLLMKTWKQMLERKTVGTGASKGKIVYVLAGGKAAGSDERGFQIPRRQWG